ncbi:hypothetical protein KW800_02245 [Candidatus Parcubacteria bacterium]|nr:hypothetical protein [Candidatus Parcubacteria bacterium]
MKKSISTISHSVDHRARIFWALISISGLLLGLYVYAVLATVSHTVSRESLLGESQALSARVSELEYKDIALKNTLSLDVALAKGFSEVVKPLYVSRTRGTLTLNVVSR